jgi:cobalt-zinc-cadmium efflux system protein
MAHIRKPLAVAVVLNTAVFVLELPAGIRAHSLSLVMDAVHNFSDEFALICLLCAYSTSLRMSRGLQRASNVLNSLGLVAIGGLVIWQSIDRLAHPRPVVGWLPVVAGLLAAAGNWGIARVLRPWEAHNAAIRLAYVHNLGDTYVSLAPVAAGVLVGLTHRTFFDPILAIAVGIWILGSTIVELRGAANELLWPEQAVCPHDEPGHAHAGGRALEAQP